VTRSAEFTAQLNGDLIERTKLKPRRSDRRTHCEFEFADSWTTGARQVGCVTRSAEFTAQLNGDLIERTKLKPRRSDRRTHRAFGLAASWKTGAIKASELTTALKVLTGLDQVAEPQTPCVARRSHATSMSLHGMRISYLRCPPNAPSSHRRPSTDCRYSSCCIGSPGKLPLLESRATRPIAPMRPPPQ
jgi:hypothetical protein